MTVSFWTLTPKPRKIRLVCAGLRARKSSNVVVGGSIPGSAIATMTGKISDTKNVSVDSGPTDRMTNIAKLCGAHL